MSVLSGVDAMNDCRDFSGKGRETGFARPQTQQPPTGWSLQLQSGLSSFEQTTGARRLASRGLQGLGRYAQ